jgi:hypothetical protein
MTYTFKLARRLAVSWVAQHNLRLLVVLAAFTSGWCLHSFPFSGDLSRVGLLGSTNELSIPAIAIKQAARPSALPPVQIVANQPTRDGVAVDVFWTASGGTITPSGVYTAGAAGVYKVVAHTTDGRLADTATVIVMEPPAQAAIRDTSDEPRVTPGSTAWNEPVQVEIGAPGLVTDCKNQPDFIRIDRGSPFMATGSSRQIRAGGCSGGQPITSYNAFASGGSLSSDLHYDPGEVPGITRIEVRSPGLPLKASANLIVFPNFFDWAPLLFLLGWRRDRKLPSPKKSDHPKGGSNEESFDEDSFKEAWLEADRRTLGQFRALQGC